MRMNNNQPPSFFSDLSNALNEVSEWARNEHQAQITILSEEGVLASGSFAAHEMARILESTSSTPKVADMVFVIENLYFTNTVIEFRQSEPLRNLLTSALPNRRLLLQGQWR
jgi:hypothetical protein